VRLELQHSPRVFDKPPAALSVPAPNRLLRRSSNNLHNHDPLFSITSTLFINQNSAYLHSFVPPAHSLQKTPGVGVPNVTTKLLTLPRNSHRINPPYHTLPPNSFINTLLRKTPGVGVDGTLQKSPPASRSRIFAGFGGTDFSLCASNFNPQQTSNKEQISKHKAYRRHAKNLPTMKSAPERRRLLSDSLPNPLSRVDNCWLHPSQRGE